MTEPAPTVNDHWLFGDFALEADGSRLRRAGLPLSLTPRTLQLLMHLVERAGILVSKDALLDHVWGTPHITEGVIKTAVSELRSALDDDPRRPRWIETMPRRGYRFVGAVRRTADTASAVHVEARGNMPAHPPPLVGRETELATLCRTLPDVPLTTLAGPGGVGKTSLALAAGSALAPRFADGVWLLELAPLEAEALDAAILCGMVAQGLMLDSGAGAGVPALVRAMNSLRTLLIFDNAEHVVEPLALFLDTLLARLPGLRVLVTSQRSLGLAREQLRRLPPLAVPAAPVGVEGSGLPSPAALMQVPSVRLFVERVMRRVPDFSFGERHVAPVMAICRALDGVPFALELAAARVPLLGLHGLAEFMAGTAAEHDAPLRVLGKSGPEAPLRQRSLEHSLRWSFDLLPAPQRALLEGLSVFRGGFALDAGLQVAEALGLPSWQALEALEALVDRSLVAAPSEPSDPAEPRRFVLLEGVRQYAAAHLQASRSDAAQRGFLAAMLAHWEQADADAAEVPMLQWAAAQRPELDNLRAALRISFAPGGPTEVGMRLLACTGHLWSRLVQPGEGRERLHQARVHVRTLGDPLLVARFELACAVQATLAFTEEPGPVLARLLAVLETFKVRACDRPLYLAAYCGYNLALRVGDTALRQSFLQTLDEAEHADWSPLLLRHGRQNRAYERRLQGDAEGYADAMRREDELLARLGATVERWAAAQGRMLALLDLGRAAQALALFGPTIDEIRLAHRQRQYPAAIGLWLTVMAELGHCERVREAAGSVLPVLRDCATPWMAFLALAWLAAHEGRLADAARLLGRYAQAQPPQPSHARPATYTERTRGMLEQRLEALLDAASLAAARREGAATADVDTLLAWGMAPSGSTATPA